MMTPHLYLWISLIPAFIHLMIRDYFMFYFWATFKDIQDFVLRNHCWQIWETI